jgi:alkylhydroperoxidase/carboxymuconolactone decarboxylase family protein YurZ
MSDYVGDAVFKPLSVFEKLDPELLVLPNKLDDFVLSDGALPKKVKLLIGLALDTARGSVEGVKWFVREAREAGATKEQLAETLRITQYISGIGSTYVAGRVLKELF